MMDAGEIKKLDTVTVNRIAAGEVIQRPANALKEMIENSLDAKSTSITITVTAGGLKLLQIQDNGTGIRKDNMEIVCERFTTSKLTKYEDLTTIATYGFRGEALSSISHVAQLKIQSKTKNDKVGWQASYVDGALKAGSYKQVARNQGTQITVEDLFFNTPQRKQALRGPNEEFQRISDVVSRYSVHNPHCSFTLKKTGESSNTIRTPAKSTVVDNIRSIYGTSVAKSLLKMEIKDERLKFDVEGFISNVNFTQKKGTLLLFINHRSVQSTNIKKAVDQVYSTYLPRGEFPFIYMSLEINPLIVDVNVHPTKHEVNFLHEDRIIERIVQEVEKVLLGSNESRTFYTQARLPGAPPPLKIEFKDNKLEKTIYAKDLVRTDPKAQTLDVFLVPKAQNAQPSTSASSSNKIFSAKRRDSYRKEIKLTSVLTLRKEIEDDCDADLKQLFNDLTFVGTVDKTYVIIQHDTKMYLCNTPVLTEEFYYQKLLYDFENFEKIKLTNPLSIEKLALLGLKSPKSGWSPEDGSPDDLAARIRDILIEKGPILEEYFALAITDDGFLTTLPVLFENYYPSMCFLPLYILRLATEIEWDDEIECFRAVCRETANFYSKMALTEEIQWRWDIEHIIYQKMKKAMLPPKKFNTNGSILQIANLSDMYKVFERC